MFYSVLTVKVYATNSSGFHLDWLHAEVQFMREVPPIKFAQSNTNRFTKENGPALPLWLVPQR